MRQGRAVASRLLAALVLALLLAVGCSAPLRPPAGRGQAKASPTQSQNAPSSPAPAGTIEAFVPEAVGFVEAHRGLRFKEPVKVDHLADEQFTQRIVALQRRDRADTDRQAKIYRALGLVGRDVDVERAEEQLVGSGVIGYYDPKTKELVVRGESATPAVKHVVVHELTHALQDQWFQLEQGQKDRDDDASLAYTALVEGDAVRIERQYVASLPAAERRQVNQEGGGGPPPEVPRVLVELLAFPYTLGPSFTDAVLKVRGQDGLDQAFRERPSTTSQILHPDRYLAGDKPQSVAEPAADGPAFDHGVIGEVGLDLLLEDLVQTHALSSAEARAATQGWAGDRYVAWTSGDGYCLRARFATATPAAADALTSVLQKVATTRLGVSVQPGPEPVLTSCG
jgi:hypothetical protein